MIKEILTKMKSPARRLFALLAGFVLLSGTFALSEEELDIGDLTDIGDLDIEEIELLPPDATLNARDIQWHTPGEGSPVQCDHDICYWKLPMGYTDEDAVWKVLMQQTVILITSIHRLEIIR